MNFEVITTTVDLQDIPSYKTNITLEGQLLKLSFTWNERLGKRALYIKNSAGVCYLQNKILFPNESLELNSNAVFDDLPYKVVLQKVGDIKKVGNFLNWSKDFILCFYRTVDEDKEKLIVRYGVTEPSTPTIPQPFGNWIVNSDITVDTNGIAHYTAYKTNQREYYDSYADLDLTNAVVQSLHDSDMQQWQAVTDACDELTGVTDWVLDPANNQVIYKDAPTTINCVNPTDCSAYENIWKIGTDYYSRPDCVLRFGESGWWGKTLQVEVSDTIVKCTRENGMEIDSFSRVVNTNYDPASAPDEKTLSFDVVAQKIISNTSSSNQSTSLLAETYLEVVANSISNSDESKQFVKLSDIINQFEENKVLRV